MTCSKADKTYFSATAAGMPRLAYPGRSHEHERASRTGYTAPELYPGVALNAERGRDKDFERIDPVGHDEDFQLVDTESDSEE